MHLHSEIFKYTLKFKFEAGTSRGFLSEKETWLIKLFDPENPQIFGLGESGPLKGLSLDDRPDFNQQLDQVSQKITHLDFKELNYDVLNLLEEIIPADLPSVRFGYETAFLDFINGGNRVVLENDFVYGKKDIPINGLIWMGDKIFMLKQIREKVSQGFNCIKIKIGAIDFQSECELLDFVKEQYGSNKISLRLDANGAFSIESVTEKLNILSEFNIHSLEQPIPAGNQEKMKEICATSPIPIALDEELIGVIGKEERLALLDNIKPQFIVIKPTLVGGIKSAREWIDLAQSLNIGWWITSALESNLGLNAIAQMTADYDLPIAQGLGTGQLYHNNFTSPLRIKDGALVYNQDQGWEFPF